MSTHKISFQMPSVDYLPSDCGHGYHETSFQLPTVDLSCATGLTISAYKTRIQLARKIYEFGLAVLDKTAQQVGNSEAELRTEIEVGQKTELDQLRDREIRTKIVKLYDLLGGFLSLVMTTHGDILSGKWRQKQKLLTPASGHLQITLILPREEDLNCYFAKINDAINQIAQEEIAASIPETVATTGPVAVTDSAPGEDDSQIAMRNVLSVLGEENAIAILAVASKDNLTADQKMRNIGRIDRLCTDWDSPKWARLLGVTADAIRQTEFWKVDRKKLLKKDG